MIRWIIENERYDKRYLENPNLDAAKADGETTSSDATHLVRTDKMVFLKPEDAGLEPPVSTQEGQAATALLRGAWSMGAGPPRPGEGRRARGGHDHQRHPVKSVFTLLKERALGEDASTSTRRSPASRSTRSSRLAG